MQLYSYFACVLVQTIYSTSSLNGFKNANADVLNHTQSRFLARNLYITDTTCPFNFNTGKRANRMLTVLMKHLKKCKSIVRNITLFKALSHMCQILRMEKFVARMT